MEGGFLYRPQGVEGGEELAFDGGPGVFAGDELAAARAEGGARLGVVEEIQKLGLEVGVMAEPEAGVGGLALADEHAAFGVNEAGGAGMAGMATRPPASSK